VSIRKALPPTPSGDGVPPTPGGVEGGVEGVEGVEGGG
jgi:hypothetical protein